jgi:hypothetical protein
MGKLATMELHMWPINVLSLFRSVNVCIGKASSEYEKIFQEFLHGRKFGKRLKYSLIKTIINFVDWYDN